MSEQGTTVTIGTKSIDAMWAEIDAFSKTDTPPEGSRTCAQLADAWGLSRQAAEYRARSMVRAGRLAVVNCRVADVNGAIRLTAHYLPVTKNAPKRA
jgi:hypothetical protein